MPTSIMVTSTFALHASSPQPCAGKPWASSANDWGACRGPLVRGPQHDRRLCFGGAQARNPSDLHTGPRCSDLLLHRRHRRRSRSSVDDGDGCRPDDWRAGDSRLLSACAIPRVGGTGRGVVGFLACVQPPRCAADGRKSCGRAAPGRRGGRSVRRLFYYAIGNVWPLDRGSDPTIWRTLVLWSASFFPGFVVLFWRRLW